MEVVQCMKASTAARHLDRLRNDVVQRFTPVFNPAIMLRQLDQHGILNQRTAGRSAVFESVAGCAQQDWHCDYDPTLLQTLATKPASVLLALQDNTKLAMWADPTNNDAQTVLTLHAGEMAVVRGDTVHAGAAYQSHNTRVHLYLDVPEIRGGYVHYWTPLLPCSLQQ